MEFGAMVCKPQNPFCEACIFNETCFAIMNKLVKELPIKEKKVKVGIRNLHYLLVFDSSANFLIRKRGKNDIWESLYEFVLIKDDFNVGSGELNLESFDFLIKREFEPTKHILTHQHIYATFTIGLVNEFSNKVLHSFEKEPWLNANTKAFPRLISRFLEKNEVQKFIDEVTKNEI
jgi:A/G-specific adenine glycosylase